jgi:hypothetical protein
MNGDGCIEPGFLRGNVARDARHKQFSLHPHTCRGSGNKPDKREERTDIRQSHAAHFPRPGRAAICDATLPAARGGRDGSIVEQA